MLKALSIEQLISRPTFKDIGSPMFTCFFIFFSSICLSERDHTNKLSVRKLASECSVQALDQ